MEDYDLIALVKMIHTVVILVHSSVSEDEGGTNFIPPPSELILRFLLDTDFFFDALVIIVPGVTSSKSPKSSSKLSTDPPRFLKLKSKYLYYTHAKAN